MREMRAEEDTLLSTYGWSDKSTGAVRIPIDKAMDLLAARGLGAHPTAPAAAGAQPAAPATPAPAAPAPAPQTEAHP